jgi:hypothetical protein
MPKKRFQYPEDYTRIRDRIKALYRELNTGDDDRAEATICGWSVRVRRTAINCKTRVHLEYSSGYSKYWTKTTVAALTEILYKYKGHDDWQHVSTTN